MKHALLHTPIPIFQKQSMNLVPFPSNNCLSMKERGVSTPQTNTFLSRFLKPKCLFLKKNRLSILKQPILKNKKGNRINPFKTSLNPFQSEIHGVIWIQA